MSAQAAETPELVYDVMIKFQAALGELTSIVELDVPPFRGLLVVWHTMPFTLTRKVPGRSWEWIAEPYQGGEQ